MKTIRIFLLLLILIGLGLLATEGVWLAPLVSYILNSEQTQNVVPAVIVPTPVPVVSTTTTPTSTPVRTPVATSTPVAVKPPKPVPTPAPTSTTPERCGGNMMNAHQCSLGYHCAAEPGSHLPFGDVGGICVAN